MLDMIEWGFVAAEAASGGWRFFRASNCRMEPPGATGLALGLSAATMLTALDLSSCELLPAGATAVGGALTSLEGLVWLQAAHNRVGAAGAGALVAGLSRCSRLLSLGLAGNGVGDNGVALVCETIPALTALVHLDLTDNGLTRDGCTALAKALRRNSSLAALDIGGQDISDAVWELLEVLAPRLEALTVDSGIVRASPSEHLPKRNFEDEPAFTRTVSAVGSSTAPGPGFFVELTGRRALGQEGAMSLAKALQSAGEVAYLTALELDHNNISAAGASALLSTLTCVAGLARLGLAANSIGPNGAHDIAGSLLRLRRLRSLSLDGNEFGAASWDALVHAGGLSRLTSLNGFVGWAAVVTGGLETINFSGKELAAAASSLLHRGGNKTTDLDISSNCLDVASDVPPAEDAACRMVAGLSALSALTRLSLNTNMLREAGGSALGSALTNLGRLVNLDVSRTELGQGGAVAVAVGLRRLPLLQTLSFASNAVGPDGAAGIFDALASPQVLLHLDLGQNQLGQKGAAHLAASLADRLWALKTLRVAENSFGSDGGTSLAAGLAKLSRLTVLDLRCNELGPAGGKAIIDGLAAAAAARDGPNAASESSQPQGLTSLDLRNNRMQDEIDIQGLEWLSGLTTLSLAANFLGDAGGRRVMAAIARHTVLTELDLGDNNLGSECGAALASTLGRLAALKTLFLEGNALEALGAAPVVEVLASLSNLHTLDLRDNVLGPDGGIEIGRLLSRLTGLCELDLEGNELGPVGGEAVAQGVSKLSGLEALDLRHNSLGLQGSQDVTSRLSLLKGLRLDVGWNEVTQVPGLERVLAAQWKPTMKAKNPVMLGTTARKRDSHRALYSPTFRGCLQKLGKDGDPYGELHWRERLCFISQGCLYYESAKKKGEAELVTELTRIRKVLTPHVDVRPGRFMFTVEVEQDAGRCMTFAASSAHERRRWITAILRERPDEPPTPSRRASTLGSTLSTRSGSLLGLLR